MKKKLGDLTLREITNLCDGNCNQCKFNSCFMYFKMIKLEVNIEDFDKK
jgi:hypothetical protein